MVEARVAAIAEAMVELADSLRPQHDVIDTMTRLVEAATAMTPAVDVGILLADSAGRLRIVASSSERASHVEEAQLGADEGPCLDAFHSGVTVEVADLAEHRQQWPEFVQQAEQCGFRAQLAVPLSLRGQHLGGMGVFFDRTDALDDRTAALLQAMAQIATIAIIQQRSVEEHVDLARQLQRALDARVLIEQAKGLVASSRGISIDAAYQLLRGQARSQQMRLRDVAEELVSGHLAL